MENLHLLFLLILAQIIALISPGPDFALILRNALLYTRRDSLLTSLGIALGILVHASYCVYLMPFILGNKKIIIATVHYLGAIYLIYLGVKSIQSGLGFYRLRSQAVTHSQASLLTKPQHGVGFVLSGFLCNLLNPKAILFFLSLFSVVASKNIPLYVGEIAGLSFFLTTWLWFSFVSLLLTHHRYQRFFSGHTFKAVTGLCAGIVMLFFSALLVAMNFI
jgi:threonine/homoserine/homoserine lactone efflux protein